MRNALGCEGIVGSVGAFADVSIGLEIDYSGAGVAGGETGLVARVRLSVEEKLLTTEGHGISRNESVSAKTECPCVMSCLEKKKQRFSHRSTQIFTDPHR